MDFDLHEFKEFEKGTRAFLTTFEAGGDLKILKCNQRWTEKFKIPKADFCGKSILSLISSDDREKVISIVKTLEKKGEEQCVVRLVDSELITYFFQFEFKWVDGIIYLIAFDISDRQKEHQVLMEMSELTKTGAWYHDPIRDESFWSEEIYKIHELDPDTKVNGELALSFYQPEYREEVDSLVKNLYENYEGYDYSGEILTAKGTKKWIRTIAEPTIHEGRLIYINGVTTDHSRLKKNVDKIRENSELRELALKGIRSGIFDFNIVDCTVFLSEDFRRMLGLEASMDWVSDEEFMNLTHPDDREGALQRQAVGLKSQGNHYYNQYRLRHSDGTYNYYDVYGWRKKNEKGETVRMIGNLINVNDQVLLRKEQIKSHNSLMSMVNNGFINCLLMDTEGVILMADKEAIEIIRNEYGVDPNTEKVRFIDVMPDILKDGFAAELEKTLAGEVVRKEVERPLLEGAMQWVDLMYKPIFNAENKVEFVLANFMDISKRKRAELSIADAEGKARSLNVMKAKLLADLSHEVRTPLNGIMGSNELLLNKEKDADKRALLTMQRESSLRLKKLMSEIVVLGDLDSVKENMVKTKLEVNRLMRDCHDIYSYQARMKSLELELVTCKTDPEVEADKELLISAVGAFVNNAIKYTKQGRIEMTCVDGKKHVEIRIADSGVGMDQVDLDLLLENTPMENAGLNNKYEGSGIGLSIARRFILLNDGELKAQSEKGVGTVFEIKLPKVK